MAAYCETDEAQEVIWDWTLPTAFATSRGPTQYPDYVCTYYNQIKSL